MLRRAVKGNTIVQLSFSTSPAAKPTHWKQTVFYLKEALTICQGETVTGKLMCRPNTINPRDLDFHLEYAFSGKHATSSDTLEYRMR
jgi:type I protein arginine methyltransferase